MFKSCQCLNKVLTHLLNFNRTQIKRMVQIFADKIFKVEFKVKGLKGLEFNV